MIRLLKIAIFILLSPVMVWLAIIILDVHLPLSPLSAPLSAAASYAIGREVSFDGDITLAPTLVPTLEITDVSLGNPEGHEGKLAHLGRVYLEVDLLSLLRQKIVIEEFSAQQVRVELVAYEGGSGNWQLRPPADLADDLEGDEIVALDDEGSRGITADVRHWS